MTSIRVSARAAVRRLRSGIVPDWALDELSVGYGSIRVEVDGALRALCEGGSPRPLFVRGDWGTGKTHLLSYIRAAASRSAVASSWVDLNARSTALNYPQRFYPVIAETLRLGDVIGLKALLTTALRDSKKRSALRDLGDLQDFGWAVGSLVRAVDEDAFADLSDRWAWTCLLGADISASDYAPKRLQATTRLSDLGTLSRAIGFGGVVLIFDEAETIDQLWNIRSRLNAYSVLGRLCATRRMWCVFGVTERFDRTVRIDAARDSLFGTADQHARWFLQSAETAGVSVIRPPPMDLRSARELALAVEHIYQTGHSEVAKGVVDACVEEWRKDPLRNPRRLIRLLVHRLDLSRTFHEVPTARCPNAVDERPAG